MAEKKEKRAYVKPEITVIPMDNDISLLLQSNPGGNDDDQGEDNDDQGGGKPPKNKAPFW